ncbi:5-methyltetrahydropteroyltriglutamate--homocysteine S-methyltransferase [Corynebacterium sanguinis]|uniref:5-methyltetrahydropteroyltriglutamate--homocysteine S-methyltransferase n=1 Tax=Corynebacterium sanguinis TaxID=2594913 RepID=A0A6C1U1I0_9CORY|nr:5-methyltetrahydropteroyltriglutamate--homocysteine S-methyltransferase [Corynebacterium sanguinis]MCT1415006.1 5-methyltetrahydropteroyltriglutamate--homocysteine S-methyltransferase [Corynebacterium sanguinis]MCT1426672.1 5-methyltetrahydropteroyltriglutamate--homocysteine S-methyltransferase [Corynebacterium sanguinis]MCT1493238.1 5-methyltetrahydropteroyltriglutamate--homocysteine S-methyltransferase [Corynebacterium sanguinis]MCT1556365.1 5-methyltetrahydropteroyltriglutamate--homocyste
MNFPKATIEGYPRIGANRELKRALESYWAGRIDADTFRSTTHALRVDTYNHLRDLGLTEDYAIPADVAYYDQVLETALTVGLIPGGTDLDEEFALARGNDTRVPLEMTKWFDTNYHYLVPEVAAGQEITPAPERILRLVEEAREAGHVVRPALVGPVTLLALSKPVEFSLLDALTDAYAEILKALKGAGVEWVQLAEPALVADLSTTDEELAGYLEQAWSKLLAIDTAERPNLYLTTPYGATRKALSVLGALEPEALHVDLSPWTLDSDADYPKRVADMIGPKVQLVAGIIDGRNVWAANLRERTEVLEVLRSGGREVALSTSTSLQHVPHTLNAEKNLPIDVANWLSFADEKIAEIQALVAGEEAAAEAFARSDRAVRTRTESDHIHNSAVADRVAQLPAGEVKRAPEFAERKRIQGEALGLPDLPTTTIGSFPQTTEIRKARADHKNGALTDAEYTEALKKEIKGVIELQEEIGLDVLVHGEPERNDMVQYFAELLDGFVATENGWVQSYGSRCTRPPIVFGDVSRPEPMTVEWAKYAQSLSDKPVKGMLTGPVTILAWSFKRDDVPLSVSADQIALALADEVSDLEAAGIKVIQIDEPALRELLPLRADERPAYLDWAVRAFRLVALEAQPETQIHTHLCYSEFGQIIDAVAGLDADVTSIEAARSKMELLEDIDETFHSEIGPGVWDIHSPRVPSTEEMVELIRAALANVPTDRLWVNPDCGLKTRGYAEVEPSLKNLVAARDEVAASL